MSERETILGRIAEALRVPAPRPHSHTLHEDAGSAPSGPSDWLPYVGSSIAERIELFQTNSVDLRTRFEVIDDPERMIPTLRELAIAEEWKNVASHRNELTERAVDALGLPTFWTDGGYDVREMERCDVGISCCDALIAQTGSVLVTTKSAGGRALSVLPPHHVVLARREQLIADMPAAFALLKARYGSAYPSFMSFITGPSRTGDIERILVLGAHGPKKLTVLCL